MLRQKLNTNPDLGDLEEMLAHVQSQIEQEIDQEDERMATSLINIQESPKVRRVPSFQRSGSNHEFRRPAPRPPLARVNSEINSGTVSLNGEYSRPLNGHQSGSQTSLNRPLKKSIGEMGSQSSFKSFNSEPARNSINGFEQRDDRRFGEYKTATLPRRFGSMKERNWEEYWANEQSISNARASVMVYDDSLKRWVPSGSSSGLSKVHIYHHTQHNTFRVVGRKLNDHEVVINCGIVRGLKYNQATPTFHQWRDSRHVYGLNFSCREDADSFARAMMHTIEILSRPTAYNGVHHEEDMGYRSMTREDAALLQPQHHPPAPQMNNTPPAPPPHGSGHHRTSSAPPAPPVPPHQNLAPPPSASQPQQAPVAPPTPPAAPQPPPMNTIAAPPPPPPPPPPAAPAAPSLQHQLQAARLNKTPNSVVSNANNSNNASNTPLSPPESGRPPAGLNSMMNEMQRTLARRRAHIDRTQECGDSGVKWERAATLPHRLNNTTCNGTSASSDTTATPPSPISKRRTGSTDESVTKMNGGVTESVPAEWESFRQELLKEVRHEIANLKRDILDAIKAEFARR